jgi:low temperature requirement protein LtrA
MDRGGWRWTPPALRTDEEEGRERRVGPLELFLDLIFVALIAELAHSLSQHVDFVRLGEFLLLFFPTWWAWIGPTFYADRFESDDVSHRLSMFALMVPVGGMAVFAPSAVGSTSTGFALSYVIARLVLIVLWLRGGYHNQPMRPVTNRYAIGFSISVLLWTISIWVPPPLRYMLWALGLAIDLLTPLPTLKFQARLPRLSQSHLPERFGLFAIIVLGESVVSVVAGVAAVDDPSLGVLVTGALGLTLAFGMWWLYFDLIGGRPVRPGVWVTLRWGYGHLPFVMAVTALGAGMLSIVVTGPEHVASGTRWLVTGAAAAAFAALGHLATTIAERQSSWDTVACLVAAGSALVVGITGERLTGLSLLSVLVALVLLQVLILPTQHSNRSPVS